MADLGQNGPVPFVCGCDAPTDIKFENTCKIGGNVGLT